jgi:hypothetical protein
MVFKNSEIWSRLFIPDPNPDFLHIPDPGAKKGTGYRIRIRKIVYKLATLLANDISKIRGFELNIGSGIVTIPRSGIVTIIVTIPELLMRQEWVEEDESQSGEEEE